MWKVCANKIYRNAWEKAYRKGKDSLEHLSNLPWFEMNQTELPDIIKYRL
jgi:hypothetical protein